MAHFGANSGLYFNRNVRLFTARTTTVTCINVLLAAEGKGGGSIEPVEPLSLRACKFVRMSAIMTGMAVKVNFRMAAAAILDFAEREFLQQNRLWNTVFSPFAKFHANISHIIPRYSH